MKIQGTAGSIPIAVNTEKVVGVSKVINLLSNLDIPVIITKQKSHEKTEKKYNIYLLDNRKSALGHINFKWLSLTPPKKKMKSVEFPSSDRRGYGEEETEKLKDKIFVELVRSWESKRYKGVGTILMQTAMEYGLRHRCEGRMLLDANWNSHGFYYKLGMHPTSDTSLKDEGIPSIMGYIKNELNQAKEENRDPETFYLGSVPMIMPPEARQKWIAKVKENPVLYKTKASG